MTTNVLKPVQGGGTNGIPDYLWWCPGCECCHGLWVSPGHKVRWSWNGSLDKPTCSPSFLCRGQYTCHTFVRDGVIEYLGDCTHKLARQKIPMIPFD